MLHFSSSQRSTQVCHFWSRLSDLGDGSAWLSSPLQDQPRTVFCNQSTTWFWDTWSVWGEPRLRGWLNSKLSSLQRHLKDRSDYNQSGSYNNQDGIKQLFVPVFTVLKIKSFKSTANASASHPHPSFSLWSHQYILTSSHLPEFCSNYFVFLCPCSNFFYTNKDKVNIEFKYCFLEVSVSGTVHSQALLSYWRVSCSVRPWIRATHRYWDSFADTEFLPQQPEELREFEQEERRAMLKRETLKDS